MINDKLSVVEVEQLKPNEKSLELNKAVVSAKKMVFWLLEWTYKGKEVYYSGFDVDSLDITLFTNSDELIAKFKEDIFLYKELCTKVTYLYEKKKSLTEECDLYKKTNKIEDTTKLQDIKKLEKEIYALTSKKEKQMYKDICILYKKILDEEIKKSEGSKLEKLKILEKTHITFSLSFEV